MSNSGQSNALFSKELLQTGKEYRKYRKQIDRKTRAGIRVQVFLSCLIVLALAMFFFMRRLNQDMVNCRQNMIYAMDTIEQRYQSARELTQETQDFLQDMMQREGLLAAEALTHTAYAKWADTLNEMSSDGNNVEYYYYFNGKPVMRSRNAEGLPLDPEQIRQLAEDGTNCDTDAGNVYGSVPLGRGQLITMFRGVWQQEDADLLHFSGYLPAVEDGGILIYQKDDGEIVQTDDQGAALLHENVKNVRADALQILDGMDGQWSCTLADLRAADRIYQTMSRDLGDHLRLTVYHSLAACIRSTARDIFLSLSYFAVNAWLLIIVAGISCSLRSLLRERHSVWHLFGSYYLDKELVKRIGALFAGILLILLLMTGYYTIIFNLSGIHIDTGTNLKSLNQEEAYSVEDYQKLQEYRDENVELLLEKAATQIDRHPEMETSELLGELAQILKASEITIFDSMGTSTVSSGKYTGYGLGDYMLDDGEVNPVYQIMNGGINSYFREMDPETGRSYYTTRRRTSGGLIRFELYNTAFRGVLDRVTEKDFLMESDLGDCDLLYYDQTEPARMILAQEGAEKTQQIENPLTEAELHDGYFGIRKINGARCYLNVAADENIIGNYFISMHKAEKVLEFVDTNLIGCLIGFAIVLGMVLLLFAFVKIPADRLLQEDPGAEEEKTLDGIRTLLQENFSMSIRLALLNCGLSFLLFLLLDFLADRNLSLIRYLFVAKWDRGVNIFSLTLILIYTAAIWVISVLIKHLLRVISANMGPSGLTVGRLLVSMISFTSAVMIALAALAGLGVQTRTILASAGVTTAVIGIGAQSTIGNILAGFFIIFEGNFRVGDIVSLNGWTGKIREIGVRTTCIESFGSFSDYGNLRVINNSDLNDMTNLSGSLSMAFAKIPIPYETDLTQIEQIFTANAEEIRRRLPEIVDGPFYDGTVSLEDSAKLIRFRVVCNEEDRTYLDRMLLQLCTDMIESNGISIPYNQLVIHTAEEGRTMQKESQ